MQSSQETKNTWNKVATVYQEKFMDFSLYDASYDMFCKLIPEQNACILELACGPGNITKYLCQSRPDFTIDATDYAAEMIVLAKQNCPSVTFQIMDLRHINEIEKKYNGIICGFGIPYLSKLELTHFIAHSANLLLDQGIVYLSFVEGLELESGYQTGSTGDRVLFYYHELSVISKEIEKQGLKIIYKTDVLYTAPGNPDQIHTIIMAQKSPTTNRDIFE